MQKVIFEEMVAGLAKDGDAIVVRENAELDYAVNYHINGTCSRLKLLHTGILDVDKYPEDCPFIDEMIKEDA